MWRCLRCDGPIDDPSSHIVCDACVAERVARDEDALERDRARRRQRQEAYVKGALPSHFGFLIRSHLVDRDGTNCGICGDPLDPYKCHVDHIVPISRGGLHEWENVRLTHPVCNLRKGDRE